MDPFAGLKVVGLRAFVAVVEDGGFAKAARRAGMATSSLTRQVDALEEELGVQLFNRSTRAVTLTEAGESYYHQVVRILGDLDEANRSISESEGAPRGLLRVSLPVAFARLHVAPAIPRFMTLCPDIEIDATLTDSVVNLVEDRIDLAIRIGRLESSSLVARKLAPHRRLLCASQAHLAAHGTPEAPSDLARHNCLTFAYSQGRQSWRFAGAQGEKTVPVKGSLRSNNSEVLREAALGGAGLVLLPSWLIGADVKAGRLQTLLPEWEASPGEAGGAISAVYLPNRRGTRKVRAFIDFLAGHIGAPPYWERIA